MMFSPTTAQQNIYNNTPSLLHVSAFFGHHQGGTKQRKIKI
jgi:hypothetical protein